MIDELDVAFLVDTTGSMKDDIDAVKDSLFDIVDKVISKTEGLKIRFGIVSYRDHPPQDRSYVTRTFDFTDKIKRVHKEISKLKPSEGGDTPEAVADAIYEARASLSWNEQAYKVLLLVGDAPPHGRKYNHLEDDYFPDGCPKGHDPIKEMVRIKETFGSSIFIFVCGCNPLVEYSFKLISSSVKDGKYYSLDEAQELPNAILRILEGVGDLIELDRRVLFYYQKHDGAFDVASAADELGIGNREIKTSISRLIELGRIPRWPKGRPIAQDSLGIEVELGEVPDALLAGKAFNYQLTITNPSRIVVGIRILVSLVTTELISEVTNEMHDISPGATEILTLPLVPMSDSPGRSSIKVEILYGSKAIASEIYETRIYAAD